ncbi:MAG: hypothetical protein QM718_08700 [Steroidobacteraceae bacterium]
MEEKTHRAVRKGALKAKSATRRGTAWASRREIAATRGIAKTKRDVARGTGAAVEAARAKARELVESSDVYVRRHPWKALMVISAAAMVMGALLDRKQH